MTSAKVVKIKKSKHKFNNDSYHGEYCTICCVCGTLLLEGFDFTCHGKFCGDKTCDQTACAKHFYLENVKHDQRKV
jgi:hypothetical protein